MCAEKKAPHLPQGILARDQMKCLCTLQAIVKEEKEERRVHYLQEILKKKDPRFMRAAIAAALEQSSGMEQRRLESVKDICIYPSPLSNEKL